MLLCCMHMQKKESEVALFRARNLSFVGRLFLCLCVLYSVLSTLYSIVVLCCCREPLSVVMVDWFHACRGCICICMYCIDVYDIKHKQ